MNIYTIFRIKNVKNIKRNGKSSKLITDSGIKCFVKRKKIRPKIMKLEKKEKIIIGPHCKYEGGKKLH